MCDRCGGVSDEQISRQIEENIQTFGWTMQFVEGDGARNPAFRYTLGLSLYRHPEIIVFEPEPCHAYLGLKPLAWAVMDGATQIALLDNQPDVNATLALAQRYSARCFIGRANTRPNPLAYVVGYWK